MEQPARVGELPRGLLRSPLDGGHLPRHLKAADVSLGLRPRQLVFDRQRLSYGLGGCEPVLVARVHEVGTVLKNHLHDLQIVAGPVFLRAFLPIDRALARIAAAGAVADDHDQVSPVYRCVRQHRAIDREDGVGVAIRVAVLEQSLQLAQAVGDAGVAVDLEPDATTAADHLAGLLVLYPRAVEQGRDGGVVQRLAPLRLAGDDAGDLAIVAEGDADEVRAVTPVDLAGAGGIVAQRPEILLDVVVEPEEEDGHAPMVTAHEVCPVGLGHEPRHHLAEQAAHRRGGQAVRIAGTGRGAAVRMQVDAHLRVEMFPGVEMRGFEVGPQRVQQGLALDVVALFQQEMAVVSTDDCAVRV
ncbi:hypothetical protein WR25_22988 [Diploscapter pachys]|uniref:Uncharacterized protein n=1 Tax=Diploscapter pachys TaxID=2018661 RepID=A0A2A2JW37_9BILA|nr:hypothetical protein WR25_22988 [Diploscapter pachys]